MGEALITRRGLDSGATHVKGVATYRAVNMSATANYQISLGQSPYTKIGGVMIAVICDIDNSEFVVTDKFTGNGEYIYSDFAKGKVGIRCDFLLSGNYHYWFYLKSGYSADFDIFIVFLDE